MPDLHLNDHNLPYPDTIHPIIVHFVIAMIVFAVLCDLIAYFTGKRRLLEVSWWNMVVASVAIFFAIIFGQFEAALAQPYEAVKPVLQTHTLIGWSLSAIVVAMTAWRGILRLRNPLKISPVYLGVGVLLVGLVSYQVLLGARLVWVYGLHTVPVVEATRNGAAP
ncbi:DUF2231 domain-containing protein [Gloeobacter kilaueensis]|uniref:DUF2231 domain-containing protein n=1 Tax=Gloeobacter kilaueensis (strain ATCC BAA-2537 / CCAP 1431/1 / ULC 316 / JS1) TaxID=1183438 RepID=U5QK23_GLOK1|nr:DUF2231 domain-containing protein [Gloeobacter kilaueensis]AGY59276.1 hypothetical protein GKIL_3030 [Gloeobacter kilaueensis JS1]